MTYQVSELTITSRGEPIIVQVIEYDDGSLVATADGEHINERAFLRQLWKAFPLAWVLFDACDAVGATACRWEREP